MRDRSIQLLQVLIPGVIFLTAAAASAEDNFYLVHDSSEKLKAAYLEAEKGLDVFLEHCTTRPDTYDAYGAYIRIEDQNGVEFLWVTNVKKYDDEYFLGVVTSQPQVVTNVEYGKTIGFTKPEIYDWQLREVQTGRIRGGFTICALVNLQTEEGAKYVKENGYTCGS